MVARSRFGTLLAGLCALATAAAVVLPAAASASPTSVGATPATVTTAPAADEPTVTRATYAASLGSQAMDVYTPPASAGAGPFPAVVLVHGGGFVSGDKNEYTGIGPALAGRGYVAVAINYAMPAPGVPRELDDTMAAITAVRTRASALKVDPDRVALWGGSAGANLVAMAATARKAPVKAVVGWAGPYDMATANTGLYAKVTLDNRSTYLGCDVRTAACRSGRAKQASPAYFVGAATPPMLLVASSADHLQPREQLDTMRAAMAEAGRPVRTFVFPGTGHTDDPAFAANATTPSIDYLDTLLKIDQTTDADRPSDPADPVDAYYWQVGGSGSYLGAPTSALYTVAGGQARDYRGGSIYYSKATGAHAVQGTILTRYKALKGPAGTLGFPTSDELVAADGRGRRSEFTGTTSTATSTAGSGSTGSGGAALVWNAATNTARAITGPSWAKYKALGETRSVLGYATTDTAATPDKRGAFTHFAGTGGSSIYFNPTQGKANAIYGTIRARWAQAGYERSTLGYPTSDEYAVSTGRRSDFDRGAITWNSRTGATTITTKTP